MLKWFSNPIHWLVVRVSVRVSVGGTCRPSKRRRIVSHPEIFFSKNILHSATRNQFAINQNDLVEKLSHAG